MEVENLQENGAGLITFPEEVVDDLDRLQKESEVEETVEDVVEETTEETTEEINPAIETHFNLMVEEGLLKVDDDFKFDGKNIQEAYRKDAEIRTQEIAQNLINSLPEKAKGLMQYVIEGGQDLEGFFELESKQNQYSSFEVTDDESAKQLISQHLKEKGLTDRVIQYTIESYELEEALQEEAKKIQGELEQTYAQQKQAKIESERQQREAQQAELQTYVNNVTTELQDLSWNHKKKEEVYQMLFQADPSSGVSHGETILRSIYQDPKASIQLMSLISGYDPKTGNWEFDQFKDSLKTEVHEETKKKFDSYFKDNSAALNKASQEVNPDSFDWSKVTIVES